MKFRILLTATLLAVGTGFAAAQDAEVAQDEALTALPATPINLAKPKAGTLNLLADVAATPTGFLVAWNNSNPTTITTSVQARLFSRTGVPVAGKAIATLKTGFLLSGKPKLADIGGGKFVVIWKNMTNIEGGIFNTATNKITGIKVLGTTHGAAQHEVVRLANNRIAVVMSQAVTGPSNNQIRVYTFNTALVKLSGPVTMNGAGFNDYGTSPDFTLVNGQTGGFAIWRDRTRTHLYMKRFTDTGAAAGAEIKVNTTPLPKGFLTDVASFGVSAMKLTNNRILVTWTSLENFKGQMGYDIRARLFLPSGAPVGPDFRVNIDRLETQYFPEPVALAGGRFSIGWVSNVFSTLTRTHFIRTYTAAGVAGVETKTHIIPPVPTDSNIDTSLALLTDGSLVNVFHQGPDQAVVADGIAANLLK